MDQTSYYAHMREKHQADEGLCIRCGKCCGADNDPCANLMRQSCGTYICKIYKDRLGQQKTVKGESFSCVPIRENIKRGFSNPDCGYIRKRSHD